MVKLSTNTNQVVKVLPNDHTPGVYSLEIRDESKGAWSVAVLNSVTTSGSFLLLDFDYSGFITGREYVLKLKNDGDVVVYVMGFVTTQNDQTFTLYDNTVVQPPTSDNEIIVYEG